jgi:nitrite reductase (cytochrome c-552)
MSEPSPKPPSNPMPSNQASNPTLDRRRRRRLLAAFVGIAFPTAVISALVSALLVNIWTRKQEERVPFTRVVDVTEWTSDPEPWGMNHRSQYDQYLRTVDVTRTRYGGSDGMPEQKIDRDPWLKRMFLGYAFSLDYRDRRGHAYMLYDQTVTERVLQRPQAGACLHCHASVIPTYRRVGLELLGQTMENPHDFNWPAVMKGWEAVTMMPYAQAFGELQKTPDGSLPTGKTNNQLPQSLTTTRLAGDGRPPTTQEVLAAHNVGNAHPVSCIDCHDSRTMALRVTRPAFVKGIQALAKSDDPVPHLPSIERWRKGNRKTLYDPNADASRQEMRSFSCAQCHVEYYCAPKVPIFYPWDKGLKVEQIEEMYGNYKFPDGSRFMDYKHTETGAEILKAQHPEFELWSQGTHAKAGVSCSDCHMPYTRQGAMKISDHWVRSPVLNIARACQQCHPSSEEDLKARIDTIQNRNHELMQRSGKSIVALIDAIKTAKEAGATAEQLKAAQELQRKAQWRLDFIAAENSMGFHAAQESARILGESIDYARQGEIQAIKVTPGVTVPQSPPPPASMPAGVTPAEQAPPGAGVR